MAAFTSRSVESLLCLLLETFLILELRALGHQSLQEPDRKQKKIIRQSLGVIGVSFPFLLLYSWTYNSYLQEKKHPILVWSLDSLLENLAPA